MIDMEVVARNGVAEDVLETLAYMTKDTFNPNTIAELAHIQLVKKLLRTSLVKRKPIRHQKTFVGTFCRKPG